MKHFKRFLFFGMGLAALIFLSGCVGRDKAGNPSGLIWDVIGQPMADGIQFFAKNSGLGYGLAIIIVTLIVRIIILPLGIYQSWKATLQSEKMNYFKPIFAPIQERIKNAETQEEKMQAQQELMAAQKENGLSMFGGIGCLPLLIQMPFFSALFFAAQYTQGVAGSSFLWIKDLAKSDWALTAIVGILYYIQSVLSLHGIEDDLAARTEGVAEEEKPSVYVCGVSFKGAHGFEGTEAFYGPFELIHANNLANTTGQTGAFDIDTEQVLAWDPDVIFVDFNGMDLIKEDYATNADFYNSLTAVKEGHVYSQISFRSSASNLETALADAYYGATILYPEQFADVDVEAKTGEIFEMLLGSNPYQDLKDAGYEFRPVTIGE